MTHLSLCTSLQHECKRVQANCIELTIELNVQVSDFPHKASRSRSFLRTTWPSGSTLNISVEVSDWTNCLSILSFGNRFCPTFTWSLSGFGGRTSFRFNVLGWPFKLESLSEKSDRWLYNLSSDDKRYSKWKIKNYKPSSKWNNLG